MQAIAFIVTCLAFSCHARRVQPPTPQETIHEDSVSNLAAMLLAFSSQPLGAKGTIKQISSRSSSSPILQGKYDATERRQDIIDIYRQLRELCRDDDSNGCDLDAIETLKTFPTVTALRKAILDGEVREFCRDDESSGCDLELIEALMDSFDSRMSSRDDESSGHDLELIEALMDTLDSDIQEGGLRIEALRELCGDDESMGCDLLAIEALKAKMIQKAGEQLKVAVPDATAEKVDDYGLPI